MTLERREVLKEILSLVQNGRVIRWGLMDIERELIRKIEETPLPAPENKLLQEGWELLGQYKECYSSEDEGPCPCHPCRTARVLREALELIEAPQEGERMNIQNAKIHSTFLGIKDHGNFTFSLTLDLGGSSIGFGGRSGINTTHLRQLLEVVGETSWETLKGVLVRVAIRENGRVAAIGHILQDRWLKPTDEYEWPVGAFEEVCG